MCLRSGPHLVSHLIVTTMAMETGVWSQTMMSSNSNQVVLSLNLTAAYVQFYFVETSSANIYSGGWFSESGVITDCFLVIMIQKETFNDNNSCAH